MEQKRALVSPKITLSLRRQCTLLGLARSTSYYNFKVPNETDWLNLIADIHGKRPAYGYRKVTVSLKKKGYMINGKKVQRLMKQMGLRSLLPKPCTSISSKESPVHPYLLKDLKITHANQAWGVDITYIRLPVGMVYLFALIDLHSRYIVGWKLAVTMEADHAIEAFKDGLKIGCPEIGNSDQGSQFTGEKWVECLTLHNVKVSHTGVGRCIDNVRIERFWWTLKYEDIHISSYETVAEARAGIAKFIKYYNAERPHQALKYKTPFDLYFGQKSSMEDLIQKPLRVLGKLVKRRITPALSMPVKSAPLTLCVTP